MPKMTIRLSDETCRALRASAAERGISTNALIRFVADRFLLEEDEHELSEGFRVLGEHPEESDVEWAFAAQSEAVLPDP